MSRVILRRSRRISKTAQGRLRRRISERPKILHGACRETLRGVYTEQDQILRGVYTERSECAQDDKVRRVQNDMRRAGSDSRRIQDDRLYPEIHNRATYSANL